MGMITNPITLPASKMIATMSAFIGEFRVSDTLAVSDIVNDLIDSSRIGKVEYGKGITTTFKLAPQPVNNLSESSTAFTITKSNVAQETIVIDNYKVVPLSRNNYLVKDAFLSGNGIDTFFTMIMSLLEDTATFHLYDKVNDLIQDWIPAQATQTIQVPQKALTGLSGETLVATEQWNATQIAKVMRKTIGNMKIPNHKYTDAATFTDVNTGETENVISAVSGSDLKIVFNDVYYTNFLADTMASLYHAERLGEMIPAENFVLLPEDSIKPANATTIAWLSTKKKFALADFYKFVLSIVDPSTTWENMFLHFAYGLGVFLHEPGVKFVANVA